MNQNQLQILKLIRDNKYMSRMDLAKALNVTPAAMCRIIKHFLEKEIIIEDSCAPSTGGRKATMLTINNQKLGSILSISLAPNKIFFSTGTFTGDILYKKQFPINNRENILNFILEKSEEIIKELENISAISIIVNGLVNEKKGVSIFSPHYQWHDVPLKKIFTDKFNLPVLVENEVRAMGMCEKILGECKDVNNFVLINVSEGIGSCIFTNGKVYHGHGSIAGEIGHIIMDRTSIRKCSCGKRGCLEAEASNSAIINKLTSQIKLNNYSLLKDTLKIKGFLDIEDILYGVKERDFLSTKAATEAITTIAHSIDMIISLINPEKIVLMGDLFQDKFLSNTLTLEIEKVILDEQKYKLIISKIFKNIYYYTGIALGMYSLFSNKEFTQNIFFINNMEVN
ncbi:ROK family transcriptional regulator [Cetobacterium ceti]